MPQYGFFPASGTDYTRGDEPTLAARLGRLGRALHLHLIGISGYRSPAHSVAVGGFADDPHTQAKASDTPGVERVPEATLRRYGLTRPFPGPSEADHIQLFVRGRTTVRNRTHTVSLADLWKQAGGPRNYAPIMAAIALAESGGRVDAQHTNTDGSVDRGLWQINSVHSQFDANRLLTDPMYNAQAAVAIFRSQGLGAWTTYTSGAYKAHLNQRSNIDDSLTPRVRPGGDSAGGSSVDTIFADYLSSDASSSTETVGFKFLDPREWLKHPFKPLPRSDFPSPPVDPLKLFTDPANAIKDAGDFLKWIAWIFHPRNVLRAVEFLSGITLMGFGLHAAMETYRSSSREPLIRRAGRSAVQATPVGRSLRVAGGARAGRRAARAESRAGEVRSARQSAQTRQRNRQRSRSNEREMNRRFGGVPF